MKKIICISDLHKSKKDLILPEGDMLIFSGDFGINNFEDAIYSNIWFKNQKKKFKDIIYVPGNHDTYLESVKYYSSRYLLGNVNYLVNDMIEIDGIKIYGSPYSLEYNNWAFMKSSRGMYDNWRRVPEGIDILVTHCPPKGILDVAHGENLGCEHLLKKVKEIKPKYHVFGHIHGGYGQIKKGEVTFINASLLDEDYDLVNKPIEINYGE